jgi:hypothetical protein
MAQPAAIAVIWSAAGISRRPSLLSARGSRVSLSVSVSTVPEIDYHANDDSSFCIDIYYNGKLTREMTDDELLQMATEIYSEVATLQQASK